MPNAMAALSNIGGALCSTPHSSWGAPNYRTILSRYWAEVHHIVVTSGGDIAA